MKTYEDVLKIVTEAKKTAPTPGTQWFHKYTNGVYYVKDIGLIEATLEPDVVYFNVARPLVVWIRPLTEFLEKFTPIDRKATKAESWGHLPQEPCRYCHHQGKVFFLIDEGPEGREGLSPVRCDNCGRSSPEPRVRNET